MSTLRRWKLRFIKTLIVVGWVILLGTVGDVITDVIEDGQLATFVAGAVCWIIMRWVFNHANELLWSPVRPTWWPYTGRHAEPDD